MQKIFCDNCERPTGHKHDESYRVVGHIVFGKRKLKCDVQVAVKVEPEKETDSAVDLCPVCVKQVVLECDPMQILKPHA